MSPRPDNADQDGSVEFYSFTGLNNRERPEGMGANALSKASNVDLDGEGRVTVARGSRPYTPAQVFTAYGQAATICCASKARS